jgi:hypothetical protein
MYSEFTNTIAITGFFLHRTYLIGLSMPNLDGLLILTTLIPTLHDTTGHISEKIPALRRSIMSTAGPYNPCTEIN